MDNIIRLPGNEETAYVKIKASYKNAKDRLYRTILVQPHLNLIDLGCILCTVFEGQLEHPFMFYTKDAEFSSSLLAIDKKNSYYMEDYTLDDLDDTFTFHYDFGDDWIFTCRKYKRETILVDTRKVIVLDGKGQGLWEDNRYGLDAYLCGMVDPESSEPDENLGVDLPWNLKLTKYADFDLPLCIPALQKELDDSIDAIISQCCALMLPDNTDEDDEDFEDDAYDNVSEIIVEMISSAVEHQVQNVPYVAKEYQRLVRKYNEDRAFTMIAELLSDQMAAVLTQDRPYSNEMYQRRLTQLK